MSDALQDFLIFDHRFEALVGCACSRIAGEKKRRHESKEGRKDGLTEEKGNEKRGENGEGLKEEKKC